MLTLINCYNVNISSSPKRNVKMVKKCQEHEKEPEHKRLESSKPYLVHNLINGTLLLNVCLPAFVSVSTKTCSYFVFVIYYVI